MSTPFPKFGEVYASHQGVERLHLHSESVNVVPTGDCVVLAVQVGGQRSEVFKLAAADCVHLASLILAARLTVWPELSESTEKQPQTLTHQARAATETAVRAV